MTRPEHAAHDPVRTIPIKVFSTEEGVPPSDRFYSVPRSGTDRRFLGTEPVQSGTIRYGTGTIGYRLVEIGYSLPDLYRKLSSVGGAARRRGHSTQIGVFFE